MEINSFRQGPTVALCKNVAISILMFCSGTGKHKNAKFFQFVSSHENIPAPEHWIPGVKALKRCLAYNVVEMETECNI